MKKLNFAFDALFSRTSLTRIDDEDNETSPLSAISITFQYYDEEVETMPKVEFGSIDIVRIPSDIMENRREIFGNDYDMFIAMDDESQELSELGEDIFKSQSSVATKARLNLREGDLYYIKRVFVNPEFRDAGIGTRMMNQVYPLIRRATGEEFPVLCLRAYPLEGEKDSAEWLHNQNRLHHWYKTLGFKRINNQSHTMIYQKDE